MSCEARSVMRSWFSKRCFTASSRQLRPPGREKRDSMYAALATSSATPRGGYPRRSMCFELDSLPPVPVIAGAAVSHEDLVLEAADGTELAAFSALPDEPSGIGVVVLPDVRGLY